MSARRYTEGKTRYELIPTNFLKELAKVYTIGADKYTLKDSEGNIIDDGSDNWRKGLSWRQTIGAIQRHLEKFKNGEDFDYDYPKEQLDKYGPTYHLANAAWGIASLLEFYKTHPEMDDRQHTYLNTKKIGLDVDDTICNFTKGYCEKTNTNIPNHWAFCPEIGNNLNKWVETGEAEEFFMNLEPLSLGDNFPIQPDVYITHRCVDSSITEKWLLKNGLPIKPVETVKNRQDKVEIAKKYNLDYFLDDNFSTFVEMNKAGICCFLVDNLHNRKYNVGYKRVKSLEDFVNRFIN